MNRKEKKYKSRKQKHTSMYLKYISTCTGDIANVHVSQNKRGTGEWSSHIVFIM